ncbi:hypothetical protein [Bordetella muralis]|jgi:small multidrug resistance pump|uniref:hypothetical protein n=1 Tax=Bordetella muralis TaxID=1649130 RepID=UPI0039EF0295
MDYGYLMLFLSSIASAAASVLLKLAADMSGEDARILLLNGKTGLKAVALGCYGAGFVFYSISLKSIPLQTAYPIMVGATILLLFIYGLVLSQPLSSTSIMGAVFVCFGIFLLSAK